MKSATNSMHRATIVAGAVAALFFLIDLRLPLGVAAAVPYVTVVLIGLWSSRPLDILKLATACSILTVIGFVASPTGGDFWMVIVNRAIALYAIWTVACLGFFLRRSDSALQESERRAASLARQRDKNPEPIIQVTSSGTITYANIASIRLVHSWNTDLGQSIPPLWLQRVSATLETGRPTDFEIDDSGRRLSLALVPDTLASTVDFFVRDITVQKRLQNDRERLGHAVEESLTEVFVFDAKTSRFLEVNRGARENLGYTIEELRKLTPVDIKPELSEEAFQDLMSPLRTGECEKVRVETVHQRKDGSTYPVEAHVQLFLGESPVFVAMILDITERSEARVRLVKAKEVAEAADRAKSQFLANMSHEIRTPMTAILGFAENLEEPDLSEQEQISCVKTIRRNGEHLLGVINDILDLSKIEAGKMDVDRADFSPCSIITDVGSLIRTQAQAKGLEFSVDFATPIPETVTSDPMRLRQILINLVGNAIKFTRKGDVRLVASFVERGDDSCLQFDVIDTGHGMTEAQAAKIFAEYSQADVSTSRKFGGSGLGLTISKALARLLGGDVSLMQTKINEGSSFRVTIATGAVDRVRMVTDKTVRTDRESFANSPAAGNKDLTDCRILLAEDNPTNQVLINGILRKVGAIVTTVEDGQFALEAAIAALESDAPFDVILMDMQMPVMDGFESTRRIREKGYAGPIIALTANAMANDRQKCLETGCDDFATKPINRSKLIDMIRAHWKARLEQAAS